MGFLNGGILRTPLRLIAFGFGSRAPLIATQTRRPSLFDCHCEERSDEAIYLDRHGALRASR